MKLSLKFFCIAYVVTLLSTGIGSAFLINCTMNMAWDSQAERVAMAENYAINSFRSFANISAGMLNDKQCRAIVQQTIGVLDSCVLNMEIISEDSESIQNFTHLPINEGMYQYVKSQENLIMEAVCKIVVDGYEYVIRVTSDFTELQEERLHVWHSYSVTVILIALVSGILLYIFANNATRPLKELTDISNAIALGEYGKTAAIKNSDAEISELTKSFNTMSLAMKQALNEIKLEAEKRERFVADFTHEMKTPMTAIIGYSEMLKTYELSDKEREQALDAIHREGKRLEHLSRQMLELLVNRKDAIDLQRVSLSEIKKCMEESLKHVAEKYGVTYRISFPEVCVQANLVLILSMLYNLSENAFKASNKGEKIDIYAISEKEAVCFYIRDYGHGIDEKHLEYLIEPFYREDKARSRKLGGAGLGLSICNEIAKAHETKIIFESKLKKGTKVSFKLKKAGDGYE